MMLGKSKTKLKLILKPLARLLWFVLVLARYVMSTKTV